MKKYTIQLIAITLVITVVTSLFVQDFSFLNQRWNSVITDFNAWKAYSLNY